MQEIGGFFGLELGCGKEYHERAIALNSARSCLRLLVRKKAIKRLLVPFYTCNAVIDALQAEAVETIPYRINNDFYPILDNHPDDYLLYINYFGMYSKNIEKIIQTYPKLIIDNAQAFYGQPVPNIDTFYSPRKFFGVPDGGYVYCSENYIDSDMETAISYDRFEHLVKRLDKTARDAYPVFLKNEEDLSAHPVQKMSKLTKALLGSINYEEARARRLENFSYLHKALGNYNEISIHLGDDDVPMVYPFLTKNQMLRQILIQNSIYIATYWPDPQKRIPPGSREAYLVSNLTPLVIDQRYGKKEMDAIIVVVIYNLSQH
jgi:hypothetical protein